MWQLDKVTSWCSPVPPNSFPVTSSSPPPLKIYHKTNRNGAHCHRIRVEMLPSVTVSSSPQWKSTAKSIENLCCSVPSNSFLGTFKLTTPNENLPQNYVILMLFSAIEVHQSPPLKIYHRINCNVVQCHSTLVTPVENIPKNWSECQSVHQILPSDKLIHSDWKSTKELIKMLVSAIKFFLTRLPTLKICQRTDLNVVQCNKVFPVTSLLVYPSWKSTKELIKMLYSEIFPGDKFTSLPPLKMICCSV